MRSGRASLRDRSFRYTYSPFTVLRGVYAPNMQQNEQTSNNDMKRSDSWAISATSCAANASANSSRECGAPVGYTLSFVLCSNFLRQRHQRRTFWAQLLGELNDSRIRSSEGPR